jgi:hypothetical protein
MEITGFRRGTVYGCRESERHLVVQIDARDRQVHLKEHVEEAVGQPEVASLLGNSTQRWRENTWTLLLTGSSSQGDPASCQAHRDNLGVYNVKMPIDGPESREVLGVIPRIGPVDDEKIIGRPTWPHDQIDIGCT